MRKTGLAVSAIVVVVAAVIIGAYLASDPSEPRIMHGDISTVHASPVLGQSDAPVTIVEFGDYQCHFCKIWHEDVRPGLVRDYIDTGRANLIYVDRAFLGRDSIPAAQASYCADEQGKYWEYHNSLYQYQKEIDDGWAGPARLQAMAFDLGLDIELFDSCLSSAKYQNRVLSNVAEGERNGVNATPTFFLVGPGGAQMRIEGAQPYSVFERAMAELS